MVFLGRADPHRRPRISQHFQIPVGPSRINHFWPAQFLQPFHHTPQQLRAVAVVFAPVGSIAAASPGHFELAALPRWELRVLAHRRKNSRAISGPGAYQRLRITKSNNDESRDEAVVPWAQSRLN